MDNDNTLTQVRSGMLVFSADGKRIGKVWHVHARDTETYAGSVGRAGRARAKPTRVLQAEPGALCLLCSKNVLSLQNIVLQAQPTAVGFA